MRRDYEREQLRRAYQQNEDADGALYIPAREKTDIFAEGRLFRVCAYCRVSTDNDEQLSSYELQQQHYRQLVGKHPNWDLCHIFADEGISGMSLKNRDEFNDMIERCFAGEFDLIVTKSVSRFARNLVDCVSLVRKLKSHNPPIGVFFETDALNTLSEDSELKLSMLATFAQEESVKKSESMNWSLKERFKSKKLLTPELFGYTRPRDAVGRFIKYAPLEVCEEEAQVVRFIYDSFLAGYSTSSIAEILTDMGVPTKTGNTKWHEGSIGYILRNERSESRQPLLSDSRLTVTVTNGKQPSDRLSETIPISDVCCLIAKPEVSSAPVMTLISSRTSESALRMFARILTAFQSL